LYNVQEVYLQPRYCGAKVCEIYEKLGGHKELVSFPGVGHESLIAAASQMWKERISRFLDNELVKP
jgi:alpha-beta hydrolase superfamily lysophospholipase